MPACAGCFRVYDTLPYASDGKRYCETCGRHIEAANTMETCAGCFRSYEKLSFTLGGRHYCASCAEQITGWRPWSHMDESTEQKARTFTDLFPVGTPVEYLPVIGRSESRKTQIRSEAWVLGSGEVVVKVEGIASGVSIKHIKKIGEDV